MTYPLTSRLPLALPHCARLHTADSFQFLKPALFPTSGPLCMQLLLPEVIFLPSASVLTLCKSSHIHLWMLSLHIVSSKHYVMISPVWGEAKCLCELSSGPRRRLRLMWAKTMKAFRFLTARERTGGRVKYCGLQRSSFKVSKDEISVGFFKGKWHDKL